mmetsp:Transcript_84490/g.262343  ORF Transcript_84490/g.262343 Transcript_84490/m.262343 type:complete len:342 (+) Transcript_84490:81-1106(+)
MCDADQYKFRCEHYEEHSQMCKEFILTVFVKSARGPHELSLFDVKNNRVFLKRGVYEQDGPIRLQDLHVNGSVTVCSRKLKIIEFADSVTREMFSVRCDQVHVLVGPAALPDLGALLSAAAEAGFTLKRLKTLQRPSAGRFVAMELVGPDAVNSWKEVVKRAASPAAAEVVSAEPVGPESEKLFEGKETTATHSQCSLCIIRPHAMREGQAGEVIDALMGAGLEISAMQTFSLLKSQAENFYEVYKTVIPSAQYHAMIGELASGVSLAMEVRSTTEDAVTKLRDLCGPYDVEIARHLRPNTLRARLGRDAVHNTVHCTDLPEDGVLESQYFFSILPGAGAN